MKIKLLLSITLLFAVSNLFAQEQTRKLNLSYQQEIFVSQDFFLYVGPNLQIGKNLDVYLFGEFIRTTPLMKGAQNFYSVGAHVSYDIAKSGTYLRVFGTHTFATKTNYGYFLVMQSINKLPVQPTFLVDTDGLVSFGIFGTVYENKWLSLGVWLNQAITNGNPTVVEFVSTMRF